MAKREKVDGIPTVAMPRVGRLTLVRGAAGSGKTQRLVEGVRGLLEQGADPASVLVVAATPDAAAAFARRLGEPGVRTVCARELAMGLLAEPGAASLFGYSPRVLMPFEEDVLFEDLKMCDVELDRVAGMLAFFERSMTEISDDHPDFLMDDDERAVMGLLRRGLRLRGAFLERQLSANAARYLSLVGSGTAYAHVFVDDLQSLSRGSQVMAALLAGESLCVAVDPWANGQVYESYPYAAGAQELLDANPGATVAELEAYTVSQAVGAAADALRREAGIPACGQTSSAPGTVAVKVLPDADAEVAHVAGLVADAVQGGLSPEDIFVVSFQDAWSERVAQALANRGVASQTACDKAELVKSAADTSRDGGFLKLLTAVLLAGDPEDDAAWRTWCAFDHPLSASGEIDVAAQIAEAEGMRLHQVLASPELSKDTGCLGDAYRAGLALLNRVKGMGRDKMFRVLTDKFIGAGAPVPQGLLSLCEGTSPADGAATVRRAVLDAFVTGCSWTGADGSQPAVRIGRMDRMCGLSPRLVVFAGFVNGSFPAHDFFDETVTPPGKVEAARAACASKLSCAVAKAADTAVFTAFRKIDCATAEKLGIKIDRIGLEKRVRMARVSPSIFCDTLGL